MNIILSAIAIYLNLLIISVSANTKYVKILPTDAKVWKPRPRIPIPSSFAKKYWVSGTFFNKQNFEGLPMSFYFSGSKCINFPEHKSLSSLKPYGCVMLYNSQNCYGQYAVVSDDMADLTSVGMHNSIGSMRSCPPVDDSWKNNAQQGNQISQASGSYSAPILQVIVPVSSTSAPSPEVEQVSYKTIDVGDIGDISLKTLPRPNYTS